MITLLQRCQTEPFEFARANLIDDFNLDPDYDLVKDSILNESNLDTIQKSLLAATVDSLCGKFKIIRPNWVFDPSTYLETPYFAMNAKGLLRIALLQESPKWYRSRNLFVTANCDERI